MDPIPKMDDDFEETSLGDACSQDVFVDSFVNGEHQWVGVFVNMFFVFTVFTLIWERFPIFRRFSPNAQDFLLWFHNNYSCIRAFSFTS